MARLNTNAELWGRFSAVGIGRAKSGGASTTLGAAVAAGAATFDVVSATGIAANDILRIGSGSEMEIVVVASVAALVVTPVHAVQFAHAAGQAVIEQAKTDLGPTTDDGVSTDAEGDFSAVFSGTRRMVYGYSAAHYAPSLSFSLRSFILENLAVAYGMLESAIQGSGTAAVPSRLVIDPSKFGLDLDAWFYFTGVLHDTLTNIEARAWGCEVDWTQAGKHQFRTAEDAGIVPVTVRVTSAIELLSWK